MAVVLENAEGNEARGVICPLLGPLVASDCIRPLGRPSVTVSFDTPVNLIKAGLDLASKLILDCNIPPQL
jgi:hypothetical protein